MYILDVFGRITHATQGLERVIEGLIAYAAMKFGILCMS